MTTDEPPRRFFIAHMQKTAGTTVRDRLRATFTDDEIYPNASDGTDPRHAVISVSYLQERWAARGDEIRLLTGHFPVRTVELLDAPFVRLTVVRHPVERTLSFLRHQAARRQRGATEDTPLDEIYDGPVPVRRHDPQPHGPGAVARAATSGVRATASSPPFRTRVSASRWPKEALAGIELFGLQSRLDEFCDELAARYDLVLGEPVRSNTTEPTEVPAGLEDRIAEDNALDMELYDFACRLYEERHP